jgi:hypothetical protein
LRRLGRSIFIRAVRRFGLRLGHSLLTAVFAALILHAFKIVFSGHLVRTCVVAGAFDRRALVANANRGSRVPGANPRCPIIKNYFDAESFANSAIASCTVVMNCAGNMIVEFLSTEISAIV